MIARHDKAQASHRSSTAHLVRVFPVKARLEKAWDEEARGLLLEMTQIFLLFRGSVEVRLLWRLSDFEWRHLNSVQISGSLLVAFKSQIFDAVTVLREKDWIDVELGPHDGPRLQTSVDRVRRWRSLSAVRFRGCIIIIVSDGFSFWRGFW